MDEIYPLVDIGIIILLLVIKAIISNAKSAISNVNENIVRKDAEEKNIKQANMVLELLNKPPSYIYAIDIVITIISVMIGFIYCKSIYYKLDVLVNKNVSDNYFIKIAIHTFCVLVVVAIVVLVGSLIPKKLAMYNTEKKAYDTIKIITVIMKILRPFTILFSIAINCFIKIIGIKPEELMDNVTEEEIISMVNEGHEQGVLEEKEVKMINKIIETLHFQKYRLERAGIFCRKGMVNDNLPAQGDKITEIHLIFPYTTIRKKHGKNKEEPP